MPCASFVGQLVLPSACAAEAGGQQRQAAAAWYASVLHTLALPALWQAPRAALPYEWLPAHVAPQKFLLQRLWSRISTRKDESGSLMPLLICSPP